VEALTPAERRGALLVALLLALGAGHDLWRAWRPLPVREARMAAEGEGAGAASDPVPAGAAADPTPAPTTDLNRASAPELDRLPGVGPVLAARIIDYRAQHGAFRRVEELMAVRGIGPRLYARLAPRVTVAGGDRRAAPPAAAPTAGPAAGRKGLPGRSAGNR
jgi:comEA protein